MMSRRITVNHLRKNLPQFGDKELDFDRSIQKGQASVYKHYNVTLDRPFKIINLKRTIRERSLKRLFYNANSFTGIDKNRKRSWLFAANFSADQTEFLIAVSLFAQWKTAKISYEPGNNSNPLNHIKFMTRF